jgi:hypothetical protein
MFCMVSLCDSCRGLFAHQFAIAAGSVGCGLSAPSSRRTKRQAETALSCIGVRWLNCSVGDPEGGAGADPAAPSARKQAPLPVRDIDPWIATVIQG